VVEDRGDVEAGRGAAVPSFDADLVQAGGGGPISRRRVNSFTRRRADRHLTFFDRP
jgi:hypothetical protein